MDTREWESSTDARPTDQTSLIDKLADLGANRNKLLETLRTPCGTISFEILLQLVPLLQIHTNATQQLAHIAPSPVVC